MKKIVILLFPIALILAPLLSLAMGNLSLSQTNLSLAVGQNTTITAYPPSNQIVNITSMSNTYVALANITNNIMTVYGVGTGNTQITLCTSDNTCGTVYVTVGGGNSSYGISFSQMSVNLNLNQSANVTIYGTSTNYYIYSNSNPYAVTANLSGQNIYLYAQNSGSSTLIICANYGGACGTLYTYVNQYSQASMPLAFSSTSLPVPVINQYYSAQIMVNGGTAPYSFNLAMGFLPAGLSMSNSGLISGVAYSGGTATFTLITSDAYGRNSPNQTFMLTPSYTAVGNVLGAYSYNNGALINDSGTVYIIYKNTKSGFTSSYAFTRLGYSFANVISGTTSGINSSGYTISNPNMAHPWGSWIKSGATIYFVDPSGLIPIPSFDVFTGNGGIAQQVVNMNSYDTARPIMPIMTNNDPRLR